MPQILDTNELVTVVRDNRIAPSFLRGRYFPTGPRDIFTTPKVFIERSDEGAPAAPFVIPYSGAKLMEREGYTGESIEPAFINPSRDMTIDQLMKKGIGETYYDTTVTPADREQEYLADDLIYLETAVQRTQEWMCGQILTNGYVDCAVDASGNRKVRLQYYGASFDNLITFTGTWAAYGIYKQISEACADIDAQYGQLDLILGANLVMPFLTDTTILKLLDIRNANFGTLNPGQVQPDGTGFLGQMMFGGRQVNIFTYNAKATLYGANTATSFIDPAKYVVLPSTGFGCTKFGAITQMEEQDRNFHTYAAEMVPRIITDPKSNARTLEMASACAPLPYKWDSWRVCQPTLV